MARIRSTADVLSETRGMAEAKTLEMPVGIRNFGIPKLFEYQSVITWTTANFVGNFGQTQFTVQCLLIMCAYFVFTMFYAYLFS